MRDAAAGPDSAETESGPDSIIILVQEEGARRTLEYDGESMLSIGRADDCDIVLQTNKSSRRHAEIFGEAGRFTLLDKGSANGTTLNGDKVSRNALQLGDEIRIGKALIQFGEKPAAPRRATAGARAAAPSTTSGSTEAAAPLPPSLRPRPQWVQITQVVVPLLLIGVLAWGIATMITERGGEPSRESASREPGTAGTTPEASPDWAPAEDELSFTADHVEASENLRSVLEELREDDLGWDFMRRLEEFRAAYPGTRAERRAREWIEIARDLQASVDAQAQIRAEEHLQRLLGEERFGDAQAVARFLISVTEERVRDQWQGQLKAVETTAQSRFRALEKGLSELLEAGEADDAVRALIEVRDKFWGLSFYDELLPRYIEASLTPTQVAEVAPRRTHSTQALQERASLAFDECRFRDLSPIYYRLLVEPLSAEDRIQALEGLVEAFYLERLLDSFLGGAGGQTLEVEIARGAKLKVLQVNEREIVQEVKVAGQAYPETVPWARVSPERKYQLFRAVPLDRDAVLGLAYFSFRVGFEQGAHRSLIRLRKRDDSRDLADAVLAQKRGLVIPEGGFVEYRGRLVTPEEKTLAEERRRQAKQAEREALAALKKAKREQKLGVYVEQAMALRAQSNFEAAHRILTELSQRFADTDVGAEATRILQNPVLARHELEIQGPGDNRLDFVFMGDGYPVENDYQEAFLHRVTTCKHLFLNEEPYREYRSYLNFYALQLGSRDTGLTRLPDGDPKDTALGGQVEWDIITMNNGKVQQILRQEFGEFNDGMAICIGNDTAGVATGGGGVVSLAKGTLIPVGHEVGHALGALLDEYDFSPGTDPDRPLPKGRGPFVPTAPLPPNVMAGSDRDDVLRKVIWDYWIEAGEEAWWNRSQVSIFEGANRTPFNAWRPQMDCKMRNASSRFCVVCMEHMVLSIYRYVRPIDGVSHEEKELTMPPNGELVLKVYPMKPATHYLEATWFLEDLGFAGGGESAEDDDPTSGRTGVSPDARKPKEEDKGRIYRRVYRSMEPEGRIAECAEIRTKDLQRGRYRLTVEIKDPTEWVIRDEDGLLKQTREWILIVE